MKINAVPVYCTLYYFQYFLQSILQLLLILFIINTSVVMKKMFLNMIMFIKEKIVNNNIWNGSNETNKY